MRGTAPVPLQAKQPRNAGGILHFITLSPAGQKHFQFQLPGERKDGTSPAEAVLRSHPHLAGRDASTKYSGGEQPLRLQDQALPLLHTHVPAQQKHLSILQEQFFSLLKSIYFPAASSWLPKVTQNRANQPACGEDLITPQVLQGWGQGQGHPVTARSLIQHLTGDTPSHHSVTSISPEGFAHCLCPPSTAPSSSPTPVHT